MRPNTCRWIGTSPEIDLKYGPAALAINQAGRMRFWAVSRTVSGYQITEEAVTGRYLPSVEVDTTFGSEVSDWSCTCKAYKPACGRRKEPGCDHCRILHAAMGKLCKGE